MSSQRTARRSAMSFTDAGSATRLSTFTRIKRATIASRRYRGFARIVRTATSPSNSAQR
jgi:hypothetical protein